MSQKIIRAIYEARLATWAAARVPALTASYENTPADPAEGATHLRASLLPADTDSQDLAGAHRVFRGVFQVSVYAPINTGPGAATGIADELAALFVYNARLTSGSVTVQQISPASIAPALQFDSYYVLPVSFGYRADTV